MSRTDTLIHITLSTALVILAGVALSGCAATSAIQKQVATRVVDDASSAQVMATAAAAAGDAQAPTRAQCYAAWAAISKGVASATGGGIFTSVETAIEVQGAIQRPECQAIAGQVVTGIIQKLPGL